MIDPAAPTTSNGAVSPMARESGEDRAGQDARHGRGQDVVAHHLPPGRAQGAGAAPERVGTARIASRVAITITGRPAAAKRQAAGQQARPASAAEAGEDARPSMP